MGVNIVETNMVVPTDSSNRTCNQEPQIQSAHPPLEEDKPSDIIGKCFEADEFRPKKELSPEASFLRNVKNRIQFTNRGHAKALLSKNWYRITRHPG